MSGLKNNTDDDNFCYKKRQKQQYFCKNITTNKMNTKSKDFWPQNIQSFLWDLNGVSITWLFKHITWTEIWIVWQKKQKVNIAQIRFSGRMKPKIQNLTIFDHRTLDERRAEAKFKLFFARDFAQKLTKNFWTLSFEICEENFVQMDHMNVFIA